MNYALSDTGWFVKEQGSALVIRVPEKQSFTKLDAVNEHFRRVNADTQSRDEYIRALHHSRSWRITKPLRRGSAAVRKLRTHMKANSQETKESLQDPKPPALHGTPGGSLDAAKVLCVMRSASDIGAVSGKFISMDGTLQEAGCIVYDTGATQAIINNPDPQHLLNNEQREVDYCSGSFLLTPKKVFKALGGFDEAFEYGYYEDVDYCFRLRDNRLRTVYAPNAAVFHFQNGSQRSAEETSLQVRKNREIFISKHPPALLHQPCTGDGGRTV